MPYIFCDIYLLHNLTLYSTLCCCARRTMYANPGTIAGCQPRWGQDMSGTPVNWMSYSNFGQPFDVSGRHQLVHAGMYHTNEWYGSRSSYGRERSHGCRPCSTKPVFRRTRSLQSITPAVTSDVISRQSDDVSKQLKPSEQLSAGMLHL